MAKVRFMELVDSVSGKYCKVNPQSPIFQRRKTCNVVCHIHNPFIGPATETQLAHQQRFATAHAQVKVIMNNPTELATYQEAFKGQSKYSTLRGYIFAELMNETA